MPRDGSGASDNAVEAGHNIVHGAGEIKDPHVDRADKTAPLPEGEKGLAIEGLSGGGGHSQPNAGEGPKGASN
ncbi:hypothetical protein LZ30DRAFT_784418 [Colletotrichum cereale]|nr:hypothetical protein LZ30DRAFT_784418 [Colletotrichum cereale]